MKHSRLVTWRRSIAAAALIVSIIGSGPVTAQDGRRMTVGDLIARIDQLEREVASLRITPVGTSDGTVQRLQQIETEMRRLTGSVERIEYEMRQRADQLEARLDALEAQYAAGSATASASEPVPAAPIAVQPAPVTTALAAPAPVNQTAPLTRLPESPQRSVQPVGALGSPILGDASPDLSAIPGAPTFGNVPAPQPLGSPTFALDTPTLGAPALPTGPAFPIASAPAVPTLSAQPQLALAAPQAPLTPILGGQDTAPAIQAQPIPQGGASADPETAYRDGLDLLNLGLFDDAGRKFEELISANPDHPVAGQAMFWLGDMHLRLGRNDVAAKSFLESFKRWPDGDKAPESLLKLGMTLGSLGQRDEACLTFTRFAARYPNARADLLQRADLEARRTNCGG